MTDTDGPFPWLQAYRESPSRRSELRRRVLDGILRDEVKPDALRGLILLAPEFEATDLHQPAVFTRLRQIAREDREAQADRCRSMTFLQRYTLLDEAPLGQVETIFVLFSVLTSAQPPLVVRQEAGISLVALDLAWMAGYVDDSPDLVSHVRGNRFALRHPALARLVRDWEKRFLLGEDPVDRACAATLVLLNETSRFRPEARGFLRSRWAKVLSLGEAVARLASLGLEELRNLESIADEFAPRLGAKTSRPGGAERRGPSTVAWHGVGGYEPMWAFMTAPLFRDHEAQGVKGEVSSLDSVYACGPERATLWRDTNALGAVGRRLRGGH